MDECRHMRSHRSAIEEWRERRARQAFSFGVCTAAMLLSLLVACDESPAAEVVDGAVDAGADAGTVDGGPLGPPECGTAVPLAVGRETTRLELVHDGEGFGLLWSDFLRPDEERWWLALLDERLRPRRAPIDLGLHERTSHPASLAWLDERYVATFSLGSDRDVWVVDRAGTLHERAILPGAGPASDLMVEPSGFVSAVPARGAASVTRYDRDGAPSWGSSVPMFGAPALASSGSETLLFGLGLDEEEGRGVLDLWRVRRGDTTRADRVPSERPDERVALVGHSSGALGLYGDVGRLFAFSVDETGALRGTHAVGYADGGASPLAVRSASGPIGVVWAGYESVAVSAPRALWFATLDESGRTLGPPWRVTDQPVSAATMTATPYGWVVAHLVRDDYPRAYVLCTP